MELAGADSGRVGLFAVMLLAIPFIVGTRKTLGWTLILISSWIAAYILQRLFYDILILQARTFGSLLPYLAAFAVLLAAGVLLASWGDERDSDANTKWKLGVILIAACIIASIAGVEFLGRRDEESNKTGIIYELREILHGNIKDEFATYRIYIWRNALSAYKDNPIIGSGPDTFYYAFPEEAQGFYEEEYENAHNEYVQILICQGIIGLVCYLIFIVGLLIKSIPKAFKNPLLMAVMAAFAGYCIQAFFNLSIPIVTPLLWVFAGMLANERVREMTQREMLY
jgi:O-antigen ligase